MRGDDVFERLQAGLLSDACAQPVLLIRDGSVQSANREAIQVMGTDVRGVAVGHLLTERSTGKLERLLSATGLQPASSELQMQRPGGTPEPMRFTVIPLSTRSAVLLGTGRGAAYSEEAGTQLMAANEELANLLRKLAQQANAADAARQALERVDSLRELFVAALAHDLRSPLNAVLLSALAVRQSAPGVKSGDLERHADLVARNVRSMLDLIGSLLLAARLDVSEPKLSAEPVRLDQLAREAIEAILPIADNARVAVELHAEAIEVRGDRVRLGEVFSNLLANAIRHSPQQGRVDVKVSERDSKAWCVVADQGPGVPATDRERIFERFSQAGGTRGAAGLGLYICRRIMELHRDRIWVEDNPPQGARFIFTLPLAHA